MKRTVLITFLLFTVGIQPVFAYIDPGSGSAIMSVIIGFFVAIGVVVKTFWYRIKRFLGFSKMKKDSTESQHDSSNRNDSLT